jgi:hypothetical protein
MLTKKSMLNNSPEKEENGLGAFGQVLIDNG